MDIENMDESKLVYEFYHKDQFGQEFKFEAKIDFIYLTYGKPLLKSNE